MKGFLGHIIWSIYVRPLWQIWAAMAVLVIVWGACGYIGKNRLPKIWRRINVFCCVCSAAAILFLTLYDRSVKEQFLQLVPFHFIVEAKEHIEILRSMLMNAFLFVPFGLSLPFAINKKTAKTVTITMITALVFSVCIEAAQYVFGLGRAETDDVLCNVFGTFIGGLSFFLANIDLQKKAVDYMNTKPARNASLDLLKCLSMLMVVALHATNTSMGIEDVSFCLPRDIRWLFSFLIRSFAFVAVDCFVLITGYFMCKSKFSYKKIIKLWITVFTYSFGIYFLLCIVPFASTTFSLHNAIKNAFPFAYKQYWFFTSYLTLFIISPFINKLLNSCTKSQHKTVLIVLLGLFVIIPTLFGDRLETNNGYSVCWFIVLYITAAYIRFYGLPKLHYGVLYIVFSVFAFASKLLSEITANSIFKSLFGHILNYNSIVIYLASISLFMFFLNRNISGDKPISKAIIKVSSLSFGVYLLHEHEYMRPIIWNKLVRLCDYQDNTVRFIGVMLASIVIIFIAGIAVEWIRSSVYNLVEPYIFKLTDNIKEKLKPKYNELINK